MTIDEAIAHAEWAANNCEGECSEEHHQLAEWLKELRERRCADVALEDERNILSERLGDYREFLRGARVENAALRESVRTNWYLAMSEREALRTHGVDPDDGTYITALDKAMDEARGIMSDLGIEVE